VADWYEKFQDMQNLEMSDYARYVFKCHSCLQGFKRRGMLVNHLAKRHPDVAPDEVPELNLPILRTTRDYFCQYCEKVSRRMTLRLIIVTLSHPGCTIIGRLPILGSCHKRPKPQVPTPQAPIRNRQTRKVANAKGLNRNTNLA